MCPGSSPELAIYNDINVAGVNPTAQYLPQAGVKLKYLFFNDFATTKGQDFACTEKIVDAFSIIYNDTDFKAAGKIGSGGKDVAG